MAQIDGEEVVFSCKVEKLNRFGFNQTRIIPISEKALNLEKEDFFMSALKVLQRYHCIPNTGYEIEITSSIPINAGVSSSSALVVTWVQFLLKAFGPNELLTPESVGQLTFESEVLEFHNPGGKMDQYSIALGGIIFLQTNHTNSITKIDGFLNGLIVGESGLSKNTLGLLGDLKEKALASIRTVQEFDSDFKLQSAVLEDVDKYSHIIPEELKPFFYASIKSVAVIICIRVLLLIIIYSLIIYRCLILSLRCEDNFSRLLGASLTFVFFTYIFVNIGMVSGLLPVVGVPLPLISYGGSSLITLMASFGIIMSIHKHKGPRYLQ